MTNRKILKKVVNLNNKSRKGKYLYIKQEGSPARYYKLHGKNLTKKEETGITKYYKKKYPQRKRKLQIKSKGKINNLINKGMSEILIKDLQNANTTKLKEAKTKIIEPLLKDKNKLKDIIKNETQKKIAFRYDYDIKVYSTSNNLLMHMKAYNKTFEQVKNELRNNGIINDTYVDDNSRYNIAKRLENKGYKITHDKGKGTIGRTDIKVGFRKGK